MNEVVSPDMSELVSWDDGHIGPGETYDSAEYAGHSMAPYVWNTTTGKQLDRWPTNVEAIPGGEDFKGRTSVSKDLSHFVFTSDIPFAPGGEPGDMYDNNTKEATIEIINFDEEGNRISVSPVETSTDGTHILMTSKNAQKQPGWFTLTNGSGELFMRVEGQTYDIAGGHNVQIRRHDPRWHEGLLHLDRRPDRRCQRSGHQPRSLHVERGKLGGRTT